MVNIDFTNEIKIPAKYVVVLPFVGESILLSEIFGKGIEYPADMRQPAETNEEAAGRLLMEQCDASPLIIGPLAIEELEEGDEKVQAVYYWSVVEQKGQTESMAYGAANLFQEKQLNMFPHIQERKVLFDEALKYAKVVASELAKVKST